jgi:protein gp37
VNDTPTVHVAHSGATRPFPTPLRPLQKDLWHARVPVEFAARVFATIALTPQHTYQILTKRPERMRKLMAGNRLRSAIYDALRDIRRTAPVVWSNSQARMLDWPAARTPWPLPNVWLGTSIESDEYCSRADELRRTPATVKFLSLEPLLGPLPSLDLTGIDWVIAGGESGPRHRPLDLDWVRDIRDRCQETGTRFFFKQIGGSTPKAGGRELDGRTWDEMPEPAGPKTLPREHRVVPAGDRVHDIHDVDQVGRKLVEVG